MELEINHLKKSFKKKEVLKNINFKVNSGKIYGFLGLNGAGKTTLIKCIFNELYFTGKILINNKNLAIEDYEQMYYFPENNDLPQNVTVYEYLYKIYLFANKNKSTFLDNLKKEGQIFSSFNLKKTKIGSLSSGQQKIVSLLACKLVKPKIIFFDEPTANLDVANKETILKMILALKNENNIIIITTHLIDEVQNYLDHLIILHQGIITYDRDIKSKKEIKEIFLKVINYDNKKLYI